MKQESATSASDSDLQSSGRKFGGALHLPTVPTSGPGMQTTDRTQSASASMASVSQRPRPPPPPPRPPRSPPRSLPPPPPPPPRSTLGRASLTFNVRPPSWVPFKAAMALSPSSPFVIFHKAEPARAPGVAIGHDADAIHLTMGFEHLPQFFFRSIEVEIPNENILQANSL